MNSTSLQSYKKILTLLLLTTITSFNLYSIDTKPYIITNTLLVNTRMSEIWVIITDSKNNQYQIKVRSGEKYNIPHKPQELKKIVCYENNEQNTTLSQNDLNTYGAFVLNADGKTDKYHFISAKEKNYALRQAHENRNHILHNKIIDMTAYIL